MNVSHKFDIGPVKVGSGQLFLIAGPCVIESEAHVRKMADAIQRITSDLGIPYIFKSSYDKANRTSVKSFRGPGLEDFDFSIFKNHNLGGEKLKLQFRAETFNLLNRANFQFGALNIFNGSGQLVPVVAQLKPPTVTSSRQIQFGMKFIW